MRPLLLLLTCLAWRGALPASARALEWSDGPASVEIRASKHRGRAHMRFADELTLLLRVSGSRVEVEVDPQELVLSPDWRVQAAPATALQGGWEQAFRLAPLKPGTLEIALAPWRYRIDGGEWQRTRWQPLTIDVVSQADAESLTKPRDITAIETVPAPPSRASLWMVFAVLALVLLLSFVGWRCMRLKRRAAAKPPPSGAAALRHLQRLEQRNLVGAGQAERFAAILSVIVRRYLGQRYGLAARRQTTPELRRSLQEDASLATHAPLVIGLLERCDAVRFAQASLAIADAAALVEQCRNWIRAQASGA